MTTPHSVDIAWQDGLATLTYHDPRLNVLHSAGLEDLIRALLDLAARQDLRLLVFTGGGERAFIGGADIGEMATLNADSALTFIGKVHQVCHLLRTLPVPSIARVQGYCLGAGMEVAAACDLRIGSTESHYGMPEVQVGLPSVVEAALLPSLIGWGRTRELLYTGRMIGAEEAAAMGFLQTTAPPAGLDAAMAPWVEAILAAEPGAIRAQKRLIEGWLDHGVPAGVRAGMDAFAASFQTDAPNQRLAAFQNRKRGGKGSK